MLGVPKPHLLLSFLFPPSSFLWTKTHHKIQGTADRKRALMYRLSIYQQYSERQTKGCGIKMYIKDKMCSTPGPLSVLTGSSFGRGSNLEAVQEGFGQLPCRHALLEVLRALLQHFMQSQLLGQAEVD
jgi:hypothetical protein